MLSSRLTIQMRKYSLPEPVNSMFSGRAAKGAAAGSAAAVSMTYSH